MGKTPTIRDVANLAKVSIGTVSRVVNEAPDVKPAVRKKVEEVIRLLGYVPNAAAKSMRMGRSHTIGCILREINIAQLGGFISKAQAAFDEAGYSLLISTSEGKREREMALCRSFANGQVDGMLMGSYAAIEGEFEDFLKALRVPLVMIDRDEPKWCDAVYVDHESGVYDATSHLLRQGHRRIALLTGAPWLHPAVSRLRGFRRAFKDHGLVPDPELIGTESFLRDYAYRASSAMLGLSKAPTAIISGGIDMLSGIIRAIRTRGLSIPHDVSVVASGKSDLCDLHMPPIGFVDWNQSEVGETAAALLLDIITGGRRDEPRRVIIPTVFNPQGTCVPPKQERSQTADLVPVKD